MANFWEVDDGSRRSGAFDWAGAGSHDAWEADWARTHGGQYPGPGRQAYEDALRRALFEQGSGPTPIGGRGFFDRPPRAAVPGGAGAHPPCAGRELGRQ